MKTVVAIYNQNQLEKLTGKADYFSLMVPNMALLYETNFDIDYAISYCRKNHINFILNIAKIYLENELEQAVEFIKKYWEEKFIISDLGIFNFFKCQNHTEKVIYDAPTMICNSSDLSLLSAYNFDAISISNEITINDVIEIFNKTKASIYYQIFGRKLMFYSKRKLLSLYKKYRQLNFTNENLSLKEEKRSYLIPCFENETGFYCYRHYFISSLSNYKQLESLKYGFIETINLDIEALISLLDLIHSNTLNSESIKMLCDKFKINVEDGFNYQDTIYIKEKIIQ